MASVTGTNRSTDTVAATNAMSLEPKGKGVTSRSQIGKSEEAWARRQHRRIPVQGGAPKSWLLDWTSQLVSKDHGQAPIDGE